MKARKTINEIRSEAKEKTAEINTGKNKLWSPMDRDNTMTFWGAYEVGYQQAIKDMADEN